jgi:hypothetical protein
MNWINGSWPAREGSWHLGFHMVDLSGSLVIRLVTWAGQPTVIQGNNAGQLITSVAYSSGRNR